FLQSDCHSGSRLQAADADFAVTHLCVNITESEQRTIMENREIKYSALSHFPAVHIAAVGSRRTVWNGACRRGIADDTDHGIERHCHAVEVRRIILCVEVEKFNMAFLDVIPHDAALWPDGHQTSAIQFDFFDGGLEDITGREAPYENRACGRVLAAPVYSVKIHILRGDLIFKTVDCTDLDSVAGINFERRCNS